MKNEIAIIGMSCMFPDANTADEFATNLAHGIDSVRALDIERLIHSAIQPDLDYKEFAHLKRVDLFDHKFFSISKRQANLMHPEQRLILQLICEAIENAGYSLKKFSGTNTALYLGTRYDGGYSSYVTELEEVDLVPNLSPMICGRVSHLLNLNGPSVAVDTLCSSSLVAIHEACKKIVYGEADMAIAGGIKVQTDFTVKGHGSSSIISPNSRCRSFDIDADGIVGGEGGGVVILKSLANAKRDGDFIHAVIKGSAINHDGGRCNGLTSPSPQAQVEVIAKAWKDSGVEPETITYVEGHGSGTSLGDSIELQSLTDVFQRFTNKTHFCAVGSVKSNIGHLDNAAGITGMLKAILSLKTGTLFPTLHYKAPNPYVDLATSALYVNSTAKKWNVMPGTPRRCGVSSFGLSGTNAHVVLEEYMELPVHPSKLDSAILKISAKSPEAFLVYRKTILESISNCPAEDWRNIALTITTGRNDYTFRQSYVANSLEELVKKMCGDQTAVVTPVEILPRKVVLLFSDTPVDRELLKNFAKQHQGFARYLHEFTERFSLSIGDVVSPLNPQTTTIALQYVIWRLLKEAQVNIDLIISNGLGKITNDLINNPLADCTVLSKLLTNLDRRPLDTEKLKEAGERLGIASDVVFVEATPQGDLSNYLKQNVSSPTFNLAELISSNNIQSLYSSLYDVGVNLDWTKVFDNDLFRKSPNAPTYPFEAIRCWPEKALDDATSYVRDWMYKYGWHPADKPTTKILGKRFLVFTEDRDLGYLIAKGLGTGNRTVNVTKAPEFNRVDKMEWCLPWNDFQGFESIAASLKTEQIAIDGIIYAMGWSASSESLSDHSIIGLLGVTKAFHEFYSIEDFSLVVLTQRARAIVESDLIENPFSATLHGFITSWEKEYVNLKVKCIDWLAESDMSKYLASELSDLREKIFVAYRSDVRYVPVIIPRKLKPTASQLIFAGKTFLITGGASGLGLEVCKWLAQQGRCNIIIIGRRILPPKDQWKKITNLEGFTHEILRSFTEIEQMGTSLEYFSQDLSDTEGVREILKGLADRKVVISGVVHAAGVPGNARVKNCDVPTFRSVLGPKVQGTTTLYHVVQSDSLEFFVNFSSISAYVGSEGGTAYSAACIFQNAFAEWAKNVITINWPGWRETGMLHRLLLTSSRFKDVDSNSILVREGLRCFEMALIGGPGNYIVSKAKPDTTSAKRYFDFEDGRTKNEAGSGNQGNVQSLQGDLPDSNALRKDWTDTENRIANIWREVLECDELDLNDTFFHLGGDSLNGSLVVNRIDQAFGVALDFTDFYQNDSLRKLAMWVDARIAEKQLNSSLSLHPVEDQEHYPLSHGQTRLWIFDRFNESNNSYNVTNYYDLDQRLDLALLQTALDRIVKSQEILRTIFMEVSGTPRQRVLPFRAGMIPVEFRSFPADTFDRDLEEFTKGEFSMPFHLDALPLIKITLINKLDVGCRVIVSTHHIISDGTSMKLLNGALLQTYGKATHDLDYPPNLEIQYRDYAIWNRIVVAMNSEMLRKYWDERLKNFTPLKLPYVVSSTTSSKGVRRLEVIDHEVTSRLKEICKAKGYTHNVILQSVFSLALAHVTNTNDIAFCCLEAGRDNLSTERLLGMFINTVIFRVGVNQNESIGQLVQRVNNALSDDLKHKKWPFEQLVDNLRRTTKVPASDLTQVRFNFFNAAMPSEELTADETVKEKDMRYNLSWSILSVNDQVLFEVEYVIALLEDDFVTEIIRVYKELLALTVESFDTPVSEILVQVGRGNRHEPKVLLKDILPGIKAIQPKAV